MPDLWSTVGPLPLAPPGGILWRGSSKLVSPIGIADSIAFRRDYSRTPIDPVGITGVQTFAQGFNRTANDPFGLTDSGTFVLVQQPSYDSTGAGNKTTGTSMSWAHTIGTGAKALLAGLQTEGGTPGITVGGTSMTQLGAIEYQTSTFALWLYIFGLLNPPTGAQTVSCTGLSTGSNGSSVSYNSVSSFGTFVTNSATTGTALSHTVSAAVGQMVFQMFGDRSGTAALTGYNQTQRYNEYTSGTDFPILIGDASGAASVVFSATANASGRWASAAVPLIA